MSQTIEQAVEGLERAHHAGEHGHGGGEGGDGGEDGGSDHGPRNVAILIAVLAAALALTELGEKAAQNSYLTHHISVSDTYAFLQAKNVRRTTYTTSADVIASLPQTPETAKRIEALRAEATRMADDPKTGEGSKQLLEKATELSHERDHAFHTYHQFERATGALQISIVLASVSIVTRMRNLTYLAAALGFAAAAYGLLVATAVV